MDLIPAFYSNEVLQMIKQIYLENWKSFDAATLHIDPLTVLIGANASGKSNMLDALVFLQRTAANVPLASVVNGMNGSMSGLRGGNDWLIRSGERTARITVIIGVDDHPLTEYEYTIEIERSKENRLEIRGERLDKIRIQKRAGGRVPRNLFRAELQEKESSTIPTYYKNSSGKGLGNRYDLPRTVSILSQCKNLPLIKEVQEAVERVTGVLKSIFVFDPIPSTMRDYVSLDDKLLTDGSNVAGVIASYSKKEVLERELSKYLSRLPEREIISISAEKIGKFQTDAMLYAEEALPNKQRLTVDARGMSDGTLRIVAIMTALLTSSPGSLVGIEEIDNGLHPSRAKLLVEFLREIRDSRGLDVICTTHNPALLDAFGNTMIPFISVVYRDEHTGGSRIRLLEEVDILPRLLARGSVGDLVTKGKLEKAVHHE